MLIRLTIAVFAGLIGGVAGGIAGCLYAGNHAVDFEVLGQRGYEAGAVTGVLGGFVLAGLAGFLLSSIPWVKRERVR